MNEALVNRLIEAGVDYSGALHRFLNKEEMLVMFLKKYNEDTSVDTIKEMSANGDYEAAFKAAHTLKGLAGNLGITSVQSIASDITEQLRGKAAAEIDIPRLESSIAELVDVDSNIMALIDEI